MLGRFHLCLLVIAGSVAVGSAGANGAFVKTVTDFEGSFLPEGVFGAKVVFQFPSNASTTLEFLDPNAGDKTYLTDTTAGPFTEVHSGTQSLASYWGWLDSSSHVSWVRLQTTDTPHIPNPALHLGGKVRVWIAGTAYTSGTFATEVTGGQLWVGLGVRETGLGIPQGGDGGTAGDVEWVGLSDKLVEVLAGTNGFCDTSTNGDDVQVLPPGSAAGPDDVCVNGGSNGIIDSTPGADDEIRVTPVGRFSLPLDRTYREYVFDLPTEETLGNVYDLVGDGALGATPNNRGTLEHLVLTNDPNNAAVNANVILLWIDDIVFESPVLDPPVISTNPRPRPLDTQVKVTGINSSADLVEVFIVKQGEPDYLLASEDPNGASTLTMATSNALPYNVFIAARQTIGTDVSDNSALVKVSSPGNGPVRLSMAVRETDQYDHDLGCGDDGTGYDPDAPSNLEFIGATGDDGFGIPAGGKRILPQVGWQQVCFNPCTDGVAVFSGNGIIDIDTTGTQHTNGVFEGLYFRIDASNPTTGPYTVYLDDLTVINGTTNGVDCFIDDFESYTPADYIIGDAGPDAGKDGKANTTAAVTDVQVVPVNNSVFPGQIIVAPGGDGTLETEPQGDDLWSTRHARFNFPGTAGTSQGLDLDVNTTGITNEEAFSGSQSLKVQFAYLSASNDKSLLRLTSNGSTETNPPETFDDPDSVIPFSLDGTWCDEDGDIEYCFMMLMEPVAIQGDCDLDGDVDLYDYGCFQECFGQNPLPMDCEKFDYEPDSDVDLDDFVLFQLSYSGIL